MEQLCVHALLVQLYAKQLVAEGEIPPAPGAKGFGGAGKQNAVPADELKAPVWLGKDYQLQCQPAGTAGSTKGSWQRGHWRSLSTLVGPVAAPLEWWQLSSGMQLGPGWWRKKWQVMQTWRLRLFRSTS